MHEMSLAENVLQGVEAAAAAAGAHRVVRVMLEIGRLAAVEPEALRFCFESVVRGSLAEGAALEIIEQAGRGWCVRCDSEVAIDERYDPCPQCGDFGLAVRSGEAMRIREIEVE